jgi:hypothetical protein
MVAAAVQGHASPLACFDHYPGTSTVNVQRGNNGLVGQTANNREIRPRSGAQVQPAWSMYNQLAERGRSRVRVWIGVRVRRWGGSWLQVQPKLAVESFSTFRRALKRSDQLALDDLFAFARLHLPIDAYGTLCSPRARAVSYNMNF